MLVFSKIKRLNKDSIIKELLFFVSVIDFQSFLNIAIINLQYLSFFKHFHFVFLNFGKKRRLPSNKNGENGGDKNCPRKTESPLDKRRGGNPTEALSFIAWVEYTITAVNLVLFF